MKLRTMTHSFHKPVMGLTYCNGNEQCQKKSLCHMSKIFPHRIYETLYHRPFCYYLNLKLSEESWNAVCFGLGVLWKLCWDLDSQVALNGNSDNLWNDIFMNLAEFSYRSWLKSPDIELNSIFNSSTDVIYWKIIGGKSRLTSTIEDNDNHLELHRMLEYFKE